MPMTAPLESNSGPPELPGIHGHVGLNERHGRIARQRTSLRADDAGARAFFEAVRLTDREHVVAHFELIGIADAYGGQIACVDFQHRDVGDRVDAEHFRFELAAIGQLHGDALGVAHHVRVGQNHAVGADDEARAEPALWNVVARNRHLAEELRERIVVAERGCC